MPKITGLAHVCIVTKDLAACRRFYVDLLGCPHHFDFTKKGEVTGFYCQLGATNFIEVFQADDDLPATGSLHHFCLETDDIEGMRQRLIDQGIRCTDCKLGSDDSWQFWCKDPNGISFEFHHYTDKSAQLHPHDVEIGW